MKRPLRRNWLFLLALVVAACSADVFRIGWFADDFHFLDIARRHSLWSALGGQYGIWPWFRPLSRELFFELIVGAGSGGLLVAHGLALACMATTAFLLQRIGSRLVSRPASIVGALLFASYGYTKFLTAWASGFQDLLALLLTLGAIDAAQSGRVRRAVCLAGLAPFAKETGFLVFPLLALMHRSPPPRSRPLMKGLLLVGLVDVAIHAAVRWQWHPNVRSEPPPFSSERLLMVAKELLGGWVPAPGELTLIGVAIAAIVALLSVRLLPSILEERVVGANESPDPPIARARLLAAATLLTLAPLLLGSVLRLTLPHTYHAFPAIPWIGLALGSVLTLRTRVATFVVPALLGWSVLALPFQVPDLDQPTQWHFTRWDWREATRLTAVSHRLSADVRTALAQRPDSVIVLYEDLPQGCFFQTEDGPATREVLSDPTAKGYWINDPGPVPDPRRLVVLTFDPGRLHLVTTEWSSSTALVRAMRAVIARRPTAALAFAAYGGHKDAVMFDRQYVQAGAMLQTGGPHAYRESLEAMGLTDTTGIVPDSIAAPLTGANPVLGQALANVLRYPLTARVHRSLAHTLQQRGVLDRAGFELRLAVTLDPGDLDTRLELVGVMTQLGGYQEALAELRAMDALVAQASPAVRTTVDELRAELTRRMAELGDQGR